METEIKNQISDPDSDKKLWTKESILILIDTVKKYDEEFSSSVKKHVWVKVAEVCKTVNKNITAKACETKWKALKRTYKSCLAHNNSSGQRRRYWEYFDKIHEFMFKKPEITPVAVCSSLSGLNVFCEGE